MADFKNTIDVLGDDAVIDSIINRTIPEYKDDTITKTGTYSFYKCTALETVDVPNAEYLANFSFSGCAALKTVNIPKVATIGDSVFASCEALESVSAPALVTLNSSDFRDCKALQYVNFPALENIIGASCFAGCRAMESADFPKLKSMSGGTTFHNCPALTALILRNTAAVATLTGAMSLPNTTYIYVPAALHTQYAAASNWSTMADQFRKLEEWTVDGTVTGALATNRHMVRFFNSDGTLLGYKIVTTGSDAMWDGDTPVNPDGEDPFTGFNPEPVNVTADMDCYASYVDPYAEQWEAVFASINAGTYATDYAVGDTVPLNLGTEGIINMQIAAFDADDLADGSGKAPITWIAKELLASKHRMNPALVTNDDGTYQEGTGTIGGWEKCEMRTYLKETIKPLIPENVRNAVKEVTKSQVAYDTAGSSYLQTTTEDVWITADMEIAFDYSIYAELLGTDAKRIKGGSSTWWNRDIYSKEAFNCIRYSGKRSNLKADSSSGTIVLCFCT